MAKKKREKEKDLVSMVEDLLWGALSAGRQSGDPNVPPRAADEAESKVWHECQRVIAKIEELQERLEKIDRQLDRSDYA